VEEQQTRRDRPSPALAHGVHSSAAVDLLASIENASLSTALRESALMYPAILALHSIGMAFVVGMSAMFALTVLGVAPGLPLAAMRQFFTVLWSGFAVNLLTGLALLAMAATTHLTDPVMYFKLLCIAAAVVIVRRLQRDVVLGRSADGAAGAPRNRALAATSLALWALAVTAGRLTAYTFFRFWT
jgi:hypothetical protein